MSVYSFKSSFNICKHNNKIGNGITCRLCLQEQYNNNNKHSFIQQPRCSHGIIIGSNECWGCSYNKGFKQCCHNELESKCKICKWNQSCEQNKMCQHWVPVTDNCYICEREKKRQNHFHNETIKLQDNNFFEDRITQLKDYVNPNDVHKTYPMTINENMENKNLGNESTNIEKTEISGRGQNNRTKDSINGNINSFMKRSLDTIGFIEHNNNKNIWCNPISNNSFPNVHISDNDIDNIYLGISTRDRRKLDNTDFNSNLHLRRSMLQPDFRQGNRFYEEKPTNTRRESFRDLGNQNAQKFQTQTEQMYREMNYTKAYDNAAGINRG